MTEYIEREAVLEILRQKSPGTYRGMPCYPDEISASFREVSKLPAADVVPMDFHERCLEIEIQKRLAIEQKHGRWIERSYALWYCDKCGYEIENLEYYPSTVGYNYCPNCGARMDGEG